MSSVAVKLREVWTWIDSLQLIYNMMPDKNDWSQCKLAWMSSFPDNFYNKKSHRGPLQLCIPLLDNLQSSTCIFKIIKTIAKFSNAIGYQ